MRTYTPDEIYTELRAEIVKLGGTAMCTGGKLFVEGALVEVFLGRKYPTKHLNSVGRQTVTVGLFGDASTMTQNKNGTFDFESFAQIILIRARNEIRARQRRANKEINLPIAKSVDRRDIGRGMSVDPSDNLEKPIWLNFNYCGAMTPERYREVRAGLLALGLTD